VRLRWPKQRKRDGSLYNISDCRRATQNCLKTHNNTLFMKDSDNENCWAIFKSESDTKSEKETMKLEKNT